MRTPLSHGVLAIVACLGAHALRAQCADGTPPPCGRPTAGTRAATPKPNSVAVLYFTSTSTERTDSYLGDGLTDEIIVRLARVHRLDVKSRNEVRLVSAAAPADVPALLRRLNVAYLVSGSVQPTRAGLRVRVELTRGEGMRAMWGATFQRADTDLAAVTAVIADSVAQGVIGQLLPDERQVVKHGGTRNAAAYDLYLRGLAASRDFAYDSFLRAEGLFAEAVRIDSTFSDAWAARGDLWGWIADAYTAPPLAYPKARAYAAQALRFDSTNALAWSTEADVRQFYDWNAAGALEAAQRAARIDPARSISQLSLGVARGLTGDTAGAAAAFERAFLLDSLDGRVARVVPQFLSVFANRPDEALSIARRVYDGPLADSLIEPNALMAAGRCAEALALAVQRFPTSVRMPRFFSCPTRNPAAIARADSVMTYGRADRPYDRAFFIAEYYLRFGDVDRALPWLEHALADRDWIIRWGWINVERLPGMKITLSDPRIVALRKRAETAPPPKP